MLNKHFKLGGGILIDEEGVILIDKSFLQKLNESETEQLKDYNVLVCPPLHDEIWGNISKKNKSKKSDAQILAKKIPQRSYYIEHSFVLANLNLLGQQIPMDGRMLLIAENEIHSDTSGVQKYRLQDWAKGRMLTIEQKKSVQRRNIISQFKENLFPDMIDLLNSAGYSEYTCKDLKIAKKLAQDALINMNQINLIDLIFRQLQINQIPRLKEKIHKIYDFCKDKNYMELKINCPYAMYVLELEVFFQIILAAKLTKLEGNSLSDAWYLHYLPFCNYFVSDDNFHKRCAPVFIKHNQKFIWGADFRAMLKSKQNGNKCD